MKLFDFDDNIKMTLVEAYEKGMTLQHTHTMFGKEVISLTNREADENGCGGKEHVDIIRHFLFSDGWSLLEPPPDVNKIYYCGVKADPRADVVYGHKVVVDFYTVIETRRVHYWLNKYETLEEAAENLAKDLEGWKRGEWENVEYF